MDILSLTKLTNEKWLNLFAAKFRHKDHVGRWVFASRKSEPHVGAVKADAVVIVPTYLPSRGAPKLVVLKEYRVPIGGYVYGLPAGLMEPGESIEETARREMEEETGLKVVKVKQITPPLYSSSGLTDESAALVFVDVRRTPQTKQCLDASEELEVVLWDFKTVSRMCYAPDAGMDVRVWMVLFLCQQLGRLV